MKSLILLGIIILNDDSISTSHAMIQKDYGAMPVLMSLSLSSIITFMRKSIKPDIGDTTFTI